MNQFPFDRTATVFRCLADPLRLRIYRLVLKAPGICLCDLATICQQERYNISRATRELVLAGLVDEHKESRWLHLSPAEPPTPVSFIRQIEEWPAEWFAEDERGLAAYFQSIHNGTHHACRIQANPGKTRNQKHSYQLPSTKEVNTHDR
jgi:DNA-binding transcriptional ArsR family regulator